MKPSIYNTLLPLTDRFFLLYNALTDSYLVFSTVYKEAWLKGNYDYLKDTNSNFYSQLVASGCLISDASNESELLQRRINAARRNENEYNLTINPTVACNFKCWYCYESHLSRSKMKKDVLDQVLKHIDLKFREPALKHFHLSFFGGEPLLYFKDIVYPVLLRYNEGCKNYALSPKIHFTTNGYLINNQMIDLFEYCHVSSFQITLDGCKEQHNETRYPYKGGDSYERIISNIKELVRRNMRIVLRINYTATNLLRIKEIAEDLQDIPLENRKNLHINFQKVWQENKNEIDKLDIYLKETIDIFRNMGFVVTKPLLDMLRNSCYADKENQAVINYDGSVFKCTARDFKIDNREGVLLKDGRIQWFNQTNSISHLPASCLFCKIAPLCGGGCYQRRKELKEEGLCTYQYGEEDKNKLILDRFYEREVKAQV